MLRDSHRMFFMRSFELYKKMFAWSTMQPKLCNLYRCNKLPDASRNLKHIYPDSNASIPFIDGFSAVKIWTYKASFSPYGGGLRKWLLLVIQTWLKYMLHRHYQNAVVAGNRNMKEFKEGKTPFYHRSYSLNAVKGRCRIILKKNSVLSCNAAFEKQVPRAFTNLIKRRKNYSDNRRSYLQIIFCCTAPYDLCFRLIERCAVL